MNLSSVGTSRCDVPARESAGGIVAPLNAARTAQRAVPTRFRGLMREIFRGNLSLTTHSHLAALIHGDLLRSCRDEASGGFTAGPAYPNPGR